MLTQIDDATLQLPFKGIRLRRSTLGEELSSEAPALTMLAFLRHFGCIFCREMVRDLHAASQADAGYPRVILVGQGNEAEGQAFVNEYWPDVAMICDPDKSLYQAMGLGKGSIYQMFGPSVWACGVRASLKGNFIGKPVGDPWTMPGVFVVDAVGTIRWQHTFDHAGDHPDWASIPSKVSLEPAPPALT
jgi:AhpC/TSA antioxidant enzyme